MQNKKKNSFPKCRQCGRCCIVWNGNEWIDCKYLIHYLPMDKKPVTRCTIYQHRLYAIIGKNQYCGLISKSIFNHPDCPFNNDKKKTHPKYL